MAGVDSPLLEEEASSGVAVEVGETKREEDEDELSRLEEVVRGGRVAEVAGGREAVGAALGLAVVVVVSMMCKYKCVGVGVCRDRDGNER